jgi:hypothetical protein
MEIKEYQDCRRKGFTLRRQEALNKIKIERPVMMTGLFYFTLDNLDGKVIV